MPNVKCPSWKYVDGRGDGGQCLRNLHGGFPSFGVCERCEHALGVANIPRVPISEVIANGKARRAGCLSCREKHAQRRANRLAARAML